MDLWIPITILAALSQNIRTAIQRHMKGPLGDYGASAIRFILTRVLKYNMFLTKVQILIAFIGLFYSDFEKSRNSGIPRSA